MTHYLVYWKPTTVVENENWTALRHTASNQYGKVSPGDVLWIVTSEEPGDLVLVGRQCVDHVVGKLKAEEMLGTTGLWEADYHAICAEPEDKVNLDISRLASKLSFDGVVDALPEGFTGQHLQSMRRLDYDGANLLERLWARSGDVVESEP